VKGLTMERPSIFDADFISKTFFPKDWENKKLDSINTGRCYDWAYLAYCLFEDVNLWTTDNHAWIEYQGKFYDSVSQGYDDANELPSNSNRNWYVRGPSKVDSVESFKTLWNCIGAGRTYHWGDLVESIKQLGLEPLRT
jgi:hypothetical protein